MQPNEFSAVDAAHLIREGRLTSVDLVKACVAKIEETDGALHAWVHLDAEAALARAAEMDAIRRGGRAVGPLHGIPVGIKDIIDTKDMPTACGTSVFAHRKVGADAAIVERLLEAGAVILGKTVTTEFAFMHGGETRNPHDNSRTPGGSSSGSAAAVGAYHVPLAIGTQTNGSVIRPASFCGVFGFKPTRGVISRRGILQTSNSLDQVGCFGRTLEDVALLADAIGAYDPSDNLSFARPRPHMLDGARADVPIEPNLIWFDLPFNDRLDRDASEGLEEVRTALGGQIEVMDVAPPLCGLVDVQKTIHEYEICQHQGETFDKRWDQLSETLQTIIERGRKISHAQYEDAIAVKKSADFFFAELFLDFDAILAASATGEAPAFGPATGDPVFCSIWTLAGLPTVNLPVLVGETGLPIGMQLIGSIERDDRLLRTASWVLKELQAPDA